MISRRTLLRSGATATALAGIAAAAVQCQPTEAPAAEHDPCLEVLTKYRADMDYYNGPATNGFTDEQMREAENRTWGPFWRGVINGELEVPDATTEAGAVFALRTLLAENNLHTFDDVLLRAALAYFDGRASA